MDAAYPLAEVERSETEGRAFIVAAKPPGPVADGDEERGAGPSEANGGLPTVRRDRWIGLCEYVQSDQRF